MNKTELIFYMMDEYKAALQAIEAEKAWNLQEEERVESIQAKKLEDGDLTYTYHDYYRGRKVSKAELQRIRLMLQKLMLEVERT